MYAPVLYQAKYLDDVWEIPAKNYGYMNLVTVFSILASLGWSGMADRHRKHKHILMIKALLYGLSYCTMWLLEPFMVSWTIPVRVTVITGIFFVTTIFCSAIFPLLGTLVFSILESSEELRRGTIPPKRLLGRQKFFGTLGIGMVFVLNGTLTDFIGYQAQFLIVSVSCIAFFAVAHYGLDNLNISHDPATAFIKVEKDTQQNNLSEPIIINQKAQSYPQAQSSWFKNVRLLLNNFDFLLLLFIVFLIGISGSVFNVYYSVFMGKVLKNSDWKHRIMGYMYAVRLAVELPVYIWGDLLISVFGSYGVLLIGMGAAAVRPFGYAFFINDEASAPWGFVFELFKGFSHACNGLGGCVLASDMAPPGAQGTAQALFTSAHHHAASTVSGLICTLYLNHRQVTQFPDDSIQIKIYQDLFFWIGVIGLFGTALNAFRILFFSPLKIKF